MFYTRREVCVALREALAQAVIARADCGNYACVRHLFEQFIRRGELSAAAAAAAYVLFRS